MPLDAAPRAILVDLAGVLHIDHFPIPGAVEALRSLRRSGLPIRFLTNTTRSSRKQIVANLQRMGFAIEPDEILTAVLATRHVVSQRNLRPHYVVHPDIVDEVGSSHPDPTAVVLGDAGPHFTFASLNQAFRLLMEGLPFLAMARNRYFREIDGLTMDLGAFVSALEYSSGVTAEVLGKPSATFFQSALDQMGVRPEQAILIGDDLIDDIGGAQAIGIPGILVRTGKFRRGDDAQQNIRPEAVVDDFGAAVSCLLGKPH